jgi:hypothetical protein
VLLADVLNWWVAACCLAAGDEGVPVFIQPGDVAGAHHDVGHADGLGPEHSDDSISEEEDEQDHGGHPFEDDEAALLEDELHMMEQELAGQPQEVRQALVLKALR